MYRAEMIEGKAYLVTPDGLAYREKSKAAAQAKAERANRIAVENAADALATSAARNLAIVTRAMRIKAAGEARRAAEPEFNF